MLLPIKISIVSPCFNEVSNIEEFLTRVFAVIAEKKNYNFEVIIIDNASFDGTYEKLIEIAKRDKRLKLIRNMRNFGHIRSPYYGILQSSGDATIYLASDLQDPPELIPEFIRRWEDGKYVVYGVRKDKKSFSIIDSFRKIFYRLLNNLAGIKLISNATGFGIFDKRVIEEIKKIQDPYPYFRGLVSELGFPIDTIEFNQPNRTRGKSKNNLYTLYDTAMLGFVSHTKILLRLATFLGFMLGFLSLLSSIVVLVLKLVYWDRYAAGIAPILILNFILFGAVMIFIGILGEYIASILNHVRKIPIVVEEERINF